MFRKVLMALSVLLITITVASCSPVVNQDSKEPSGNIMGKILEQDKQLRSKIEARHTREAEVQRKFHEQKVTQIRLKEQTSQDPQKKLPVTNPNLRLDRAWLNRVYPKANKVSTTKVSSENQSSSEQESSSSKYPACKVCGGGSVITKYGKKSHSSTCRYVTNTKYPTRSRSSYSSGTVRVKGYYRKDGTYVKPHTRRKPRR